MLELVLAGGWPMIPLLLLSALALSEARLDWRVARFADDAVRVRAAAMRGASRAGSAQESPLANSVARRPLRRHATREKGWRTNEAPCARSHSTSMREGRSGGGATAPPLR